MAVKGENVNTVRNPGHNSTSTTTSLTWIGPRWNNVFRGQRPE